MEPKKNPMPPLGCSKSKAVAYKRCLLNKMETINAHCMVATENRVTKPHCWKGKKHTTEQKKKYKHHKKHVKLFNEREKALLTYIRSTAFCTGHQWFYFLPLNTASFLSALQASRSSLSQST